RELNQVLNLEIIDTCLNRLASATKQARLAAAVAKTRKEVAEKELARLQHIPQLHEELQAEEELEKEATAKKQQATLCHDLVQQATHLGGLATLRDVSDQLLAAASRKILIDSLIDAARRHNNMLGQDIPETPPVWRKA